MWSGDEDLGQASGDIADLLEAIRRHAVALCLWTVLVIGAALAIMSTITPDYSAAAQLVLEQPIHANDRADRTRLFHQLKLDDATAQTQLHVILSDRVLRPVFDQLGLASSPDLSPDRGVGLPLPGLAAHDDPTLDPREEPAFDRFRRKVHARRIGLSYVIEISYQARDPGQAARVVNAVAAAYIADRIRVAADEQTVGTIPTKRRAARLEAEQLTALGAVRAGVVPEADLPDAAIRLLGDASPAGDAFPRRSWALAAACFLGLLSGIVMIAASRQADTRVRSARRLQRAFGLDALAPLTRPPSLSWQWRRDPARGWGYAVAATRAAIARANAAEPHRRIGLLGASHSRVATRLARDLAAQVGPLRGGDPPTHGSDAGPPPLAAAELDAAVLLVDIHDTTFDQVRAALAALQAADVRLLGTVITR